MAILKLVGVTAVFFLAGLLPWVDNYAHLFGFIFGFLLSYALLPFVTFGESLQSLYALKQMHSISLQSMMIA